MSGNEASLRHLRLSSLHTSTDYTSSQNSCSQTSPPPTPVVTPIAPTVSAASSPRGSIGKPDEAANAVGWASRWNQLFWQKWRRGIRITLAVITLILVVSLYSSSLSFHLRFHGQHWIALYNEKYISHVSNPKLRNRMINTVNQWFNARPKCQQQPALFLFPRQLLPTEQYFRIQFFYTALALSAASPLSRTVHYRTLHAASLFQE